MHNMHISTPQSFEMRAFQSHGQQTGSPAPSAEEVSEIVDDS